MNDIYERVFHFNILNVQYNSKQIIDLWLSNSKDLFIGQQSMYRYFMYAGALFTRVQAINLLYTYFWTNHCAVVSLKVFLVLGEYLV